ncbi:hypothetical protein KL86PLE_110070 [uncultured Pleomorphomonas sp.]|uniref:Uncharacterized protein n=1 Tax=uncultured Pleomorphomonas sp. TaxID=442121 RepID=A0A212L7G2_9HYPH|nr:hypothetical protein [uncultured Pleomorphomonas sp.]SCM73445.1 hypothetical protein KL86PLE_110070 [uncultured Pleomorphomonas sp.]
MMNNAPLSFDFVVWEAVFTAIEFNNHADIPLWVAARRTNDLPAECRKVIAEQLYTAPPGMRGYVPSYTIVKDTLRRLHPDVFGVSDEVWVADPPAAYVQTRATLIRASNFDSVCWEMLFVAMVVRAGVPPWVASTRLSSIGRPFLDGLCHEFFDGYSEQPGRDAYLATAEEYMRRRQSDLLLPSEGEWA